MEVFRLNVKHEHVRQQLPKATGYFCDCIRAESGKLSTLFISCFFQLKDLIYSVSPKLLASSRQAGEKW